MLRKSVHLFSLVVMMLGLFSMQFLPFTTDNPSVTNTNSTAFFDTEQFDFTSNWFDDTRLDDGNHIIPISKPLLSPVKVSTLSDLVTSEQRKAKIFASVDSDGDKIHDELESMIAERTAAGLAGEPVRVIVAVEKAQLDQAIKEFEFLGGTLYKRFEGAFNGFAGDIPYNMVMNVSSLGAVELVERDQPMVRMSDVSTLLTGVRTYVWDTLGYTGDPNSSIAILDTGIDDTHPMLTPYGNLDFANSKIVGWYDATADGSTSPEDMNSHGSHCAGIAAGTEYAAETGDGRIQSTWGIKYPYSSTSGGIEGYFIYYIEVKATGQVDVTTLWSGTTGVTSNDVILKTPNGTIADQVVSSASQRTLSAIANASDIGIWSVWIHVSFPTGLNQEFRATGVNTYPYGLPSDGHLRFSGVAPDTKLVSVKVFDNTGSGTSTELVDGLNWVYNNAETYHIVGTSMSLGFSSTVAAVDTATANLVTKGIVTCVSAGNDGQGANNINTPGHVDEVICVGATGDHNQITSYSSEGPGNLNTQKPDLVAPGGVSSQGAILSVDSNDQEADGAFAELQPNDMAIMQGTSMSSPYAAGVAALLADAMGGFSNWAYGSTAYPYTIKQIMMMTSYEVGTINRGAKDTVEGYGRICADAALEAYLYQHVIGTAENATIVAGDIGRKAWARHLSLTAGTTYTFNLDVPAGADFDLFLYDGAYDTYGEPILLARSINFAPGASEHITFTPTSTGTYYIVVKYVAGSGTFTFTSQSGTSFPSVDFVNPVENNLLTGSLTVQVSASGLGLSSVELRFWNDTWIDITSGYNSGTGYYEYVMNASCLEPGNVTFVARATSSAGTSYSSVNVFVSTYNPQILLVDDDNGAAYEKYYKAVLEELGFREGSGFDIWTVTTDGSPSATTLQSYEIVIWFTSDDYQTTLSATDRSNIQTFLDSGGKLFISGQDIGYDSATNAWESWLQTYLHADYIADDTNGNQVEGVAGDAVFGGVSYAVGGGDGGRNNGYPDELSPINGGVLCLQYAVTGTPGAAVRYNGTYRVVYFGFNFEAISFLDDRVDAMNRTLNFLGLDILPQCQVTSPARRSWVSSPVTVNWLASDDFGISYFEVYLDGQVQVRVTNSSTQVTVNEGNHTLRIIAVDTLGQITVRQVVIYVDNTNPFITFISPAENAVVKNGTLVDVDVFDAHLDTVYYKWDSGGWQNFSAPYDTVVPSGDGTHILYVNASDLAGNTVASSHQFICDDTAPTVTLVSPAANSVQKSGVTVDLEVNDVHLSTVYYHWDSDAWSVMISPYDTQIPAGDGSHTLYVNATDEAGNFLLVSYLFITDDTVPIITLISPANDTVQAGGTIVDLNISDTHLNTVYYRWDNGSWAVFPPPYDTQILSSEGVHVLYVNATDEAGNVAVRAYAWTVPSTGSPPEVQLVTPAEWTVHRSGTVIDLNITDPDGDLSSVYYRWDSAAWALFSSPYDTTLPVGDGSHTLYVNATDSAGHYTLVNFTFITDDTGPTIVLITPANGSYIPSGTLIDLSVNDTNSVFSVLYNWDGGSNTTLSIPYDISTTGLSEGTHLLNVYAQDEAGNWAFAQYSFVIDDTAPTIALNSPVDGAEIQSGTTIDLNISDSNGVDLALFNWDSGANSTFTNPFDISTDGLGEGTHILNVYARDAAENWVSAVFTFVVDDTIPTISLNSPANGSQIQSGTVIDLDVSDGNTLAIVVYSWDAGTEYTLPAPYDVTTSSLSEDNHTLHIAAQDSAGNWANVTYRFTIDDTSPTITLLSPVNGSYVRTGDFVSFDVMDTNTLEQVLYNWDGTTNITLTEPYNIPITGLSEGSHALRIYARDEAGNWAFDSYQFIVDDTPPTVTLQSPANGDYIQSGTIIDLAVSDNYVLSQVLYRWNNGPNITLVSPYNINTTGLNETTYRLWVYAFDDAENWASANYTFTIDDTTPVIVLVVPNDGSEIQSGTLIDLNVTDTNNVTVMYNWDGQINTTLLSPYDIDTSSLSEGAHTLNVYATDLADNTQYSVFMFIIDDTPPAIVLNSPPDGSEIQSGVVIDFNVNETNTLSLTRYRWDLESWINFTSPYDVSTIGLAEGTHILDVQTQDAAGNWANSSYSFIVDDTQPVIALVSPTDGSDVPSGTVVDLDVTDTNTLAQVLYNWDDTTNATLSPPFDVTVEGLAEGLHVLNVFACDAAGNWAKSQYSFTVDDTPPSITLISPTNGAEIKSGTLVDLEITDSNNVAEVLYAWDNNSNSTLVSPYDLPTSSLVEGTHILHVYARDAAGNWISVNYQFVVDDTAPIISLDSPPDGSEIKSGTVIYLTVQDDNTLFECRYHWDSEANTTLSSPFDISTAGLSESIHTLFVYARDNAGNWNRLTLSYLIDDTAPSITLVSPAEGSEIQSGTTIDLSVSEPNTLNQVLYNWDGTSNSSLASPYDVTTLGLNEGSHTLRVYAQDVAGNWASVQFAFVVDDTPPIVTLFAPANGSVVTTGTVIDLDVTDTNTLESVEYNWDSGTPTSLSSPYDVIISGLPEGSHTLDVTARDLAGNSETKTFQFVIDDTTPQIMLITPTNATVQQSGTLVRISVLDDHLSLVRYHWDSDSWTTWVSPYESSIPSLDGDHWLYVEAQDEAGNTESKLFVWISDDTTPIIVLNSPANGTTHHSGTLVDLSITDLHLLNVFYHWDTDVWTNLASPYDTYLPIGNGVHELHVNASDEAGNWNYKRYIFVTDDTLPLIILHEPNNNTVHVSGTLVNVSIEDNDIDTVLYRWDGATWASLPFPYDTYLPSPDGSHKLEIFVNDTAGNVETITYVFTTDDTAPSVSLLSPANDTVHTSGFVVELDVFDAHLSIVMIRWDSGTWLQLYAPYNTNFPAGDGLHTLVVNATDTLGHETICTFVFTTDDTLPSITLITPENATLHQSGVNIEVGIVDANAFTVEFSWDGASWSTWSEPFTTLFPPGDGTHMLEVRATDEAGNSVRCSFVFTVDDTAPTITLINPRNATVQISNVEVSIAVTDTHLNTIEYRWDAGSWVTTSSSFTTHLPAGDGTHKLIVNATDVVGNELLITYLWTIDDTFPTVLLLAPTNESVVTSGTTVSLDILDLHLQSVTYSWDNALFQNLSSPYEVVTPAGDGNHTLIINATDVVGHVTISSFVFVIDDISPTLTLTAPSNYTVHKSGTLVEFSATDLHLTEVLVRWDQDIWVDISSTLETVLPAGDGEHVVEARATDLAGNTVMLRVVLITDDTPPEIDGPPDLEYEYGTTGHSIGWTLYDVHPFNYEVLLEGAIIASGLWNNTGETVVICIDGLESGTYNYSILVFDEAGNSLTDSVNVTVLEFEPPTTSPSTTTTTSTTTTIPTETAPTTGGEVPDFLLGINFVIFIVLIGTGGLLVVIILFVFARGYGRKIG